MQSEIKNLIDDTFQDFKLLKKLKSNEKIKPNGWQYFANEWLSKNPAATPETAYTAYVDLMKNTFMSNEYAEFEFFSTYFKSLDI